MYSVDTIKVPRRLGSQEREVLEHYEMFSLYLGRFLSNVNSSETGSETEISYLFSGNSVERSLLTNHEIEYEWKLFQMRIYDAVHAVHMMCSGKLDKELESLKTLLESMCCVPDKEHVKLTSGGRIVLTGWGVSGPSAIKFLASEKMATDFLLEVSKIFNLSAPVPLNKQNRAAPGAANGYPDKNRGRTHSRSVSDPVATRYPSTRDSAKWYEYKSIWIAAGLLFVIGLAVGLGIGYGQPKKINVARDLENEQLVTSKPDVSVLKSKDDTESKPSSKKKSNTSDVKYEDIEVGEKFKVICVFPDIKGDLNKKASAPEPQHIALFEHANKEFAKSVADHYRIQYRKGPAKAIKNSEVFVAVKLEPDWAWYSDTVKIIAK